jgi:hypothetical protein
MTKLKCQMNVRIQMTNKGQSANAKAQMSNEAQNPNGKSKARAWTSSNVKIQMTIGPPHSNSLPPGEREL